MSVASVAIPVKSRRPRAILFFGLVTAFFWGVGQNFPYDWWYVLHGVNVGDIVFVGGLVWALVSRRWTHSLSAATYRARTPITLMWVLSALLLLSALVNLFRYPDPSFGFTDVIAMLRPVVYSALVVFVSAGVAACGYRPFLEAFLFGIAFAGMVNLFNVLRIRPDYTVAGFLVLDNPNVIGNMFGIGVALCSLLVLDGSFFFPLILLPLLTLLNLMTFSKGTWLMVGVGWLANGFALWSVSPQLSRRVRQRLRWSLALAAVAVLVVGVRYSDRVMNLFRFKLESTQENATLDLRADLARTGFYIMLENPLLGVGYRNFGEAYNASPSASYVLDPPQGQNAHNIWSQLGAVGGIPALVVFGALFLYPFILLRRLLPRRDLRKWAYGLALLMVFVISASVQLQILVQPFFWFFSGFILGWRMNLDMGQNSHRISAV